MKYKVGDKVRVRKDLESGRAYGKFIAVSEMCEFRGETVVIKRVHVVNQSYTVDVYDEPWWTDEMFEGLANGEPKFKVGDRVKAVRTEKPNKKLYIGTVYTIRELYPNGKDCFNGEPHYGVKDPDCTYIWLESELELVNEEPTPTPEPTPVININVTVNNYENACWYCRKGGLVDLYLEGAMGICPNCKRVCNDTRKGFTLTNSRVIKFKPPKRKNEPLTNEEYQALPVGTKLFIVWCWDSAKKCKDRQRWDIPGWGVKNEERCVWNDKNGRRHQECNCMYNECFDAYLEEPERPIPEPDDELPF